jgi:hypothetical protein
MPDTYGAVPFPLVPPIDGAEVADAALTLVAQFARAVLNTGGQAAYSSVCPAVTGLQTGTGTLLNPVVRKAFASEPAEEEFAESDLPAVYVYRNGGDRPYWLAEDYRVTEDTWTLLWIPQPAPQATRNRLKNFANGVVKILDRGIESMRDPSYVAQWDTDPTAGTTAPAPAALKVAIASATGAQTYTGAQLDGVTGGLAFQPPQQPTVTVTGAAQTGVVQLTGFGSDNQPRISRVILAGTGTFTGEFQLQQLVRIDTPALAAGSTLTFGLGGYVGRGTNFLLLGGLFKLEIAKWRQFRWVLTMGDASPPRSYPHTVEITLSVTERWIREISANPATAVEAQIPTSGPVNDDVRERMLFT